MGEGVRNLSYLNSSLCPLFFEGCSQGHFQLATDGYRRGSGCQNGGKKQKNKKTRGKRGRSWQLEPGRDDTLFNESLDTIHFYRVVVKAERELARVS